jgi:DNA-binding NarL/FixJ family response regulator
MKREQLRRVRVLVADDHDLVLQAVRTLLQSDFTVVGVVRTGREMVAQALRLKPDVIVADIAMPELSGIDAARELRKEGFGAKLVFLTIYSEDEFISACMEEGALGYVMKAHMKTDLIPAIRAALLGRLFISAW